jgi:hypothetical protein
MVTLNSLTLDMPALQFTSIEGDLGNGQTRSSANNIIVNGTGFFRSNSITIKYVYGNVIFFNTCEYINNFNLSCKINDITNSGLKLPLQFTAFFSMNGVNYLHSLSLIFFTSDIPIIIQILPSRGPIKPKSQYTIDVEGVTKDIDICVWTSQLKKNIYKTIVPLKDSSKIQCPVPLYDLLSNEDKHDFGKWELNLYNSIGYLNSPKIGFTFYSNPIVLSVDPTYFQAYGGQTISVFGTGFDLRGSQLTSTSYQMNMKIKDTVSTENCIIFNSTFATCKTPSHPEDASVPISFSFNNQHYITSNLTLRVDSCSPGLSGSNFEVECKPCEPGKYKSVLGFIDCFDCPSNSYQPNYASTSCIKCPERTQTFGSSKNLTDCDCVVGSWRLNTSTSGVKCESCVDGGICNGKGENPYPKSGYFWNQADEDNPFSFLECRNPIWCTGNFSENGGCIATRTGLLCEDCSFGFFKSNSECEPCNTDVQFRMLIVITFLVILILLFFKFAQLKISHLSSFSIAVSYYQIIAIFSTFNFKWPESLKNVLGL